MRHLALIVLAFLWIAPAQAETKDGPDGFGSIKFGMTKEEAWAAIGGKGEWNERGNVLKYEMEVSSQLPLLGRSLTIQHAFTEPYENRAGNLGVFYESTGSVVEPCYRELSYFLAKISGRYGIEPITLNQPPKRGFIGDLIYYDVFAFEANNGTTITVVAEIADACNISVLYTPPPSQEIPF